MIVESAKAEFVEPRAMCVALVSPGWPPEGMANGIASYSERMRKALGEKNARVFLLTHKLADDSPPVGILRLTPPRPGLIKRLWYAAAWSLDRDHMMSLTLGQGIVHVIHELVKNEGLQLLQMEETFGIARFVGPRIAVPLVVRTHGPWFLNGVCNGAKMDNRFHRRVKVEGLAIAGADAVTAPSHHVLNSVREFYRLPLPGAAVIPNPIDPVPDENLWNPQRCDPNRILFIGRFDRHKGADVLLNAFEIVHQSHPSVRLTFVGPDTGLRDDAGRLWNFKEYLQKHVSPKAQEHVENMGLLPMAKLSEHRLRAMATVVCSRYETFGNTALEAISMGCPVVASNVGGLAEVIEDGQTGLHCRPGDAEDLADKLRTLLRNPSLATQLGRGGLARSRSRNAPPTVAGQTLEFYRNVIDAKGPAKTRRMPR